MIGAGTAWALVAALAVATFSLKSFGPIVTGGRALPGWFAAVIAAMPAALLAALVVTSTLTDSEGEYTAGAEAVGVLAAGAVVWRTGSVLWAVVVAPAVTAALRLAA